MSRVKTILALGTNIGDRKHNIEEALSKLENALGCPPERVSPVIETEALGFQGPAFLNCLAVFRTGETPHELLATCKRIEHDMGRTDDAEYAPDGSRIYHDRIIDIDILTYGDEEIQTDTLIIPHPQLDTRPFIQKLLLLLQD